MTSHDLLVSALIPAMGVPGGEVTIFCQGFKPGAAKVLFGEVEADLLSASQDRVIAKLPDSPRALGVTLRVGDTVSPLFPFTLATRLATGLHPVTSPVVDQDGSIITTISGSRGQQVAQPLVRVTRSGEKIPYPCEILNPTGLAFGPDGQLYVSSRHEGVVFRYTNFETMEVVAEGLGIACGISFDSQGSMYVGDRAGKIYRLDRSRVKEEFAVLEPSVSAYHLAFDPSDRLYVTGPTFSTRDSLYRISRNGTVEVVVTGLARPQGIAVLPNGDLFLATSYKGRKGIFKVSPSGRLEHLIACPTMVGVALSGADIFLADNASLYWIQPEGKSANVV